jgi:hypothetical protein
MRLALKALLNAQGVIPVEKKADIAVRLVSYSDSAANAASRTCSTGPTPVILRYFGAPGRPDWAQLL